MASFSINNRKVGNDSPVYIIAELSGNHEQSFDLAVKTIKAMKMAGADAVKLQSYTADSMTLNSDKPWFMARQDSLWAGQRLYDLYSKGATPWEWHPKLMKIANDNGLDFFSTPFDFEFADKLESINVPAYKIASFEITDIPLIEHVARKKKPIILSTGIATKEDIQLAVETCHKAGNFEISLLKCLSSYPAPYEEMNLALIPELEKEFNAIPGLSDHTLGFEMPVAAVALGAKIIEKHFILDKNSKGIDASFSLTADEFKAMVNAVRNTEKAIGRASFEPTEKMINAKKTARSLFFVNDLKKGSVIKESDIRSLRPGLGLHPSLFKEIVGKVVLLDVESGTPVSFEHFSK